MQSWTPRQIVEELDRYIIGQDAAKRAVAIALRNRYRRGQLPPEMRDEITPKNIILMGPTGCGKTEIARRLAKLIEAPFVKVEATKFTEVGYVGRDVESIVRDLTEASIRLVKNQKKESVRRAAESSAEQRLLKLLVPIKKKEAKESQNPMELLFGNKKEPEESLSDEEKRSYASKRKELAADLAAGKLEDTILEIEVEERAKTGMDMGNGAGLEINISDMLGDMMPKRKHKRKCKLSEARQILIQEEAERLIDMDDVISEALEKAEQEGIIFLDEIDKIAGRSQRNGPDVSREGVQRDILPIVEGSIVNTKYGPVKTDYMLFIAAGAFHVSKVSDLIPELQGRFPIHVELKALTREDFVNILRQTDNAITKQYAALLSTDNVRLIFQDDALEGIAAYAAQANELSENIGARRLHTVMETLLEDISFNASKEQPMVDVLINLQYVEGHLGKNIQKETFQKYVI